jgi:site-specific DNA-methyltransferase (cytosine-N4-specific)
MKPKPMAIVEPSPATAVYDDWTFAGADTRQLTHCYHDYPARMIPQVAGRLLDRYGRRARLLFDPYCGTGTSLVEGMRRGISVLGTDLNPLARLISSAKITQAPLKELDQAIAQLDSLAEIPPADFAEPSSLRQLEFWFQPAVSARLAQLRDFIDTLTPQSVRQFFQVAFSETVRDCSNTRNEEFKLYRYDAERLGKFKPDVRATLKAKLLRNRKGLADFRTLLERRNTAFFAAVADFNTVAEIPEKWLVPGTVDIVVTSPPYGDSRTTVAYGQYSRLSAAWLGLDEPQRVDGRLMGGTTKRSPAVFPSATLNAALAQVQEVSAARALEVSAFYHDLLLSITNVARVVRPGGYACYVVGNRRVKGVVMPTDVAVADFFAAQGFRHVDTFHRQIPNKRMPLKNSPGNIAGETAATMSREYVVVMQK